MRSWVILVTSLIFLVGCTNPMDNKITKENYAEVVEKVRKKASAEDWKKVEALIMIAKMGAIVGKSEMDALEGKSFNEVIANIKEREAQQLKAAKDESEHAAKLTEMFEVVSWTKGTNSDAYGINKSVRLTLELKNISQKEMDAFEGRITVFDKLSNQLGTWRIKETEPLLSGNARKLVYDFPTIDFQNRVREIFDTKGQDLKFKFEATKILLKDGSTL